MSEAITSKKTIIAAAAAAMSGCVWAAELGSLMVFSAQGEPLEAELAVRDVATADAVAVTLAEASVYQGVGERMVLGASDVNLVVQSRSPYKVRISSAKALDMVRFPLIVQLSDSGRTSAKIYRVQLRPIQEEVAATDAKRAKVPSTVPSAAQASRTSASSASAKSQEAPKASAARRAERSAPETRAQRDSAALSETTVVKKGMTLWSIASSYRANYPKNVSTEQILVAFVRANPEAFERGRVSGLKVGSQLRAPTAAQVQAVPLDEAWALVRTARNADARVAPSESVLARARSSMRRRAPAQWRQLQASRPTAAPSAPQKAAEQKSASVKKVQTPATPKTEPAATPESKPAVTPKADEAQAAQTRSTESQPPVKPEAKTSQVAEEVKASVDEPKVESTPAQTSDSEQASSSSGWLGTILNLLVLIVVVGGVSYYWFRRQSQHRQRREEELGVVKFRRSKPAEPEQLQGAQEMLERRLQSERATERMQTAQSTQNVKSDAFERREPTLGDVSSVQENKPETATFAEKTSDFWSKAAHEPVQASASDANLSPEVLSGKLITARSFLGVGAWEEAEALLREVQAKGNEQQRRQAAELLNQVKKNAPGRQN